MRKCSAGTSFATASTNCPPSTAAPSSATCTRGVEMERMHPDLLNYDLDRSSDALDPAADMDFDFLGIQTLYDRYLIVDKKAKPGPPPREPRSSSGCASPWASSSRARANLPAPLSASSRSTGFTKAAASARPPPRCSTAARCTRQLSSCYLYKVDDSIESIMQRGIADNAYLSKWAGGLGGSWTAVRGTGGYIKGTNGEAQGVIPFLKLHNDQLVAVNQGGKRRGSGCAYSRDLAQRHRGLPRAAREHR